MSLTLPIIVFASLIGIGTGIALQQGRGCTNSAFRNLTLRGNNELVQMIIVTVSIEIIGYFILSIDSLNTGFISNPIPFSLLFIPLGGFIFGLGTVFAGGCAGGTCYRVGEGKITSVFALLGFAIGVAFIAIGPLTSLIDETREITNWEISGEKPSLTHFLPRWVWTILAGLVLIYSIYSYNNKRINNELKLTHLKNYWNPITTGFVVGILAILARISSTSSGRQFGFSTTDGIAQIAQFVIFFEPIDWAGIFIISLIGGSGISAVVGKEFGLKIPDRRTSLRFFGGGLLLGIGAMLGYGCNFGHIFGGIPELGISSIVSASFMILGNWVGSYYFYIKLNNELPISTPF